MEPILLIAAVLLSLSNPASTAAADRLRVVTTTPDLGAIASAVGGDAVEVTSIARPGEDPHFVDARPSYVRLLNQADVLIEGGAGLEAGWLPPLLDGARNAKLLAGAPGHIAANVGIAMKEVPTQLDRSLGDVHPLGNPHYLLDPENGKVVAGTIAQGFCASDSPRCETYRSNAKGFDRLIDERLTGWKATLASAKGTKIVTYHRSFDYFAERFGLDVVDTLEPKPGIPPSPTHLADLVPKMEAAHVRLIVIEPFRERNTATLVAEKSKARVVTVPLMPGIPDVKDYPALIDLAVRRIREALD